MTPPGIRHADRALKDTSPTPRVMSKNLVGKLAVGVWLARLVRTANGLR